MDKIQERKQPVFGVLVKKFSASNYDKMSKRIRLLVEANRDKMISLFFFSIDGINLDEEKITGRFWDYKLNKWQEKKINFPDHMCCRSGFKQVDSKLTELSTIIRQRGGKVFNLYRFDKWEVHQILGKNDKIAMHLPPTKIYSGTLGTFKMLSEYKMVYLKPTRGSKGLYVMRVEGSASVGFKYSYFDHRSRSGKVKNGKIKSKKEIRNKILDFYKGKRFIVQKGIQLIRHEGRLVDMRAELHKNGNGEIEITGISARLGGIKSPITTHSDAIKLHDFFLNTLDYPKKRIDIIFLAIHEFLFDIYEAIEKEFGDYGDIGIDFAVDRNDRIWYIECNSRSAKASFAKAYGTEKAEKSYTLILEYVEYLSSLNS